MSNRFKTNQGVSVCKDAKNRANVATFAPFSAVPSSPEPQIEDGNRKKQPSSSREGPGEDGSQEVSEKLAFGDVALYLCNSP
jgi:hypothetical protein